MYYEIDICLKVILIIQVMLLETFIFTIFTRKVIFIMNFKAILFS